MRTKAKSQYRKQSRRKSTKRMRTLLRRVEVLSKGVPPSALDALQLQAVAWSIPAWIALGPSQPTEGKVTDLLERSFCAQIERLEAYWKGVGRNV